jgi:transposase-like protein
MAGLLGLDELFEGRHFVLCVRWYLRFQTQLPRPGGDDGGTRAIVGAHHHHALGAPLYHYTPEFVRRWNRFARPARSSWRVDETYIKVRGKWMYLYRAIDSAGRTVDFRLSRKRDVAAAKAFFRKAIKNQGSAPRIITLDGYAASHRAVGQFSVGPLHLKDRSVPTVWKAVLAA